MALGTDYVLAAVNTSESVTNPGGKLVVIDLATRAIVREIDLGGQPDSLKISPDRRYAAIAIENERDENLGAGEPPQLPAGYLAIIDLAGASPADWTRRDMALAGLAAFAPEDPEPEFVDINARNEAVVTMQENNHIAVVDLKAGRVLRHFTAGAVLLDGVDANEYGRFGGDDYLFVGSERGEPSYPQILSANDTNGQPIGWSALSGMVALPKSGADHRLHFAQWRSRQLRSGGHCDSAGRHALDCERRQCNGLAPESADPV